MNAFLVDGSMEMDTPTKSHSMDFFNETYSTPAKRLWYLLYDRGVTQREVARLLHKSPAFISGVVSGEKNLVPEDWLKLARFFDVTLDWLLCRPDAPMYWPSAQPLTENFISRQAEEAADIVDHVSPRKRDEMLGVLRSMQFAVGLAEQDADETTKRLTRSLQLAGLVLTPRAVEEIKAVLLAFAMGLSASESS